MTTVDIVLMILLLIGAIAGYREGFLIELFSLAALVLGVLGAFKLMGYAIVLLADHFDINKTVLPYVAVAYIFVDIVGLKDNFFRDKAEKVAVVNDRHVVASEFLHPDDRFMCIISSLEGRYHVVDQILSNHVTQF